MKYTGRANASHRAFVNRALRLGLSASIAFALAGCGQVAGEKVENSQLQGNLSIWTDRDTGCRYFFYSAGIAQTRSDAMTIRYKADGKPDCPTPPHQPDSAGTKDIEQGDGE